jgi:soluble lytic murein transglycosylase-like protein
MSMEHLENEIKDTKQGCSINEAMAPGRIFFYGLAVILTASTPSVLGDAQIYQYVGPKEEVRLTNVQADVGYTEARTKARYHASLSDAEVEQAVAYAARRHHVQPALLLAVIKVESSFNPVVVSKAGAVGLMQLIPETAIRHGVRNLYNTDENIAGGAKHLRYLLDRFHGNIKLALAAYNAGERKVDRYGNIPPYKETQLYVQKVMDYYRDYKKGHWVMPVAMPTSLREPSLVSTTRPIGVR